MAYPETSSPAMGTQVVSVLVLADAVEGQGDLSFPADLSSHGLGPRRVSDSCIAIIVPYSAESVSGIEV